VSAARLEQRPAVELSPGWIGSTVCVLTPEGLVKTGTLSDYMPVPKAVFLFLGGDRFSVDPAATVSRGDLDLLGGAPR